MGARTGFGWVLLWLLVCAAGPASAQRRPGVPAQPGRFADAAARAAGFSEWGTAIDNRTSLHVMVLFDRTTRATVVFGPPTMPLARLAAWSAELKQAPGLELGNARVVATPVPRIIGVSAASPERIGLGRYRTRLDLDAVRRVIQPVAPGPLYVSVSVPEGEALTPNGTPAARALVSGREYFFYRVDTKPNASPAGTVVVEFGPTRRWLAAAASVLVLLAVFPFLALFAVREQLRRSTVLQGKDRLRVFRRWQSGIIVVAMISGVSSLFLLGFSQVVAVVGKGVAPLAAGLYLWPLCVLSVVGRLIGLPLERDAFPQFRDKPWYSFIAFQVFGGALGMAVMAVVLLRPLSAAGGAGGPVHPAIWGLAGALMLVLLGPSLWGVWLWKRRRQGAGTGEEEASPEVVESVRDLTTRLDCPVERVLLGKGVWNLPVGGLGVSATIAVVSSELARVLEPEQIGALVAAAALLAPRTALARAQQIVLQIVLLGPLLGLSYFMVAGGWGRSGAPVMLVLSMTTFITLFALQKRGLKRQETADLQVIELLSSPRVFLDALRQQEELAMATAGGSVNPKMTTAFARRRLQLERRLGLD